MTVFKVGDRVRCINRHGPKWDFRRGVIATVYEINAHGYIFVHWDGHEDNEKRPPHVEHWYTGGWYHEDFEPADPLTPFDAAVRAYIDQELHNEG